MNSALETAVGRLGRSVARGRQRVLARKLASLAKLYLDYYGNLNYDPRTNGEIRVLQIVGSCVAPQIIFDVGANTGKWALAAHDASSGAVIHCFELVPETAAELEIDVSTLSRIAVHPFGLADSPGKVLVNHFPGNTELSGIQVAEIHGEAEVREAEVDTGDAFCRTEGIRAVDLLKIDVEGYELRVLRGFEGMLARGVIGVIQFEYGKASIWTHDLLRDLYAMLGSFGYRIGKIYPTYVEFKSYEANDEDFRGPNFIAVHGSNDDLIRRLS